MASALPSSRPQALPTFPIVWAFVACATTAPSADFCGAIKTPHGVVSHDSVTHRSPVISSAAFHARPPDLPPVPLMNMGFAILCPLSRHRRPHHPVLVHRLASLLHASFRPRLAASVILPLRFANPSPPSGWVVEDLHLPTVEYARTPKRRAASLPPANHHPLSTDFALCSFRPARQVLFLFQSEAIDLDAHRLQLQLGDALVEVFRNREHLLFERGVVLHQVLN